MRNKFSSKGLSLLLAGYILFISFQSCAIYKLEPSTTAQNIKTNSFSVGEIITTSGFYNQNDGGGGSYLIQPSGVENGINCFKTKNGKFALLLTEKENRVNIKQLGASHIIQSSTTKALAKAVELVDTIFFPAGEYKIKSANFLKSNQVIEGEKSTQIYGGFILDGVSNIEIRDIEFLSWNEKWNYAIRIGKQSCEDLMLKNCSFEKKTIIYQQYSPIKNSDSITIENCVFNLQNDINKDKVVGIQLHSNNLEISNTIFRFNDIESCVKIATGTGTLQIINCDFKGATTQEILDFYTFSGIIKFINNRIDITDGAIIKTKPGRLHNLNTKNYSCLIKENTIKVSGAGKNLIYLAGSYLLTDNRKGTQTVNFDNNSIKSSNQNTILNIRGFDRVSVFENKIESQVKSGYAVNFSAIGSLTFEKNKLKNISILAFPGKTPGGTSYSRTLKKSLWNIEQNLFEGTTKNFPFFQIRNLTELNLNISNNVFTQEQMNSKVLHFLDCNMENLILNNNELNGKINKDKIIYEENSKFKSKRISGNKK